jgi:sugar phosphate isomerase/epimerase
MLKYSYNTLCYHDEPGEVSVERVARYGYDAIELAGERDRYDTLAVKAALEQHGIVVGSICSQFTPERDLAHPDADIRRGALAYVKDMVDMAEELGAATVIVTPTACMKGAPLADRGAEHQWALEGIQAAAEHAAGKGVDLTLECWNRYETYWLNRLEQAVELMAELDASNVGVMGDTFHMNIEEADIADAIRTAGPKLNHIHFADSARLAPGTGHIDFEPALAALIEVGYAGYVTMELLPNTSDPFGYLAAGKGEAFKDEYTKQSIEVLKGLEQRVAVAA